MFIQIFTKLEMRKQNYQVSPFSACIQNRGRNQYSSTGTTIFKSIKRTHSTTTTTQSEFQKSFANTSPHQHLTNQQPQPINCLSYSTN
jgi:hypothetical protein